MLGFEPVWYQYTDELGLDDNSRSFVGVIAQDAQQVAPYMVEERDFFRRERETEDGDVEVLDPGKRYLTFDASAMSFMLVNAVKEQQQMIDLLRQQNEGLLRRIEGLEAGH